MVWSHIKTSKFVLVTTPLKTWFKAISSTMALPVASPDSFSQDSFVSRGSSFMVVDGGELVRPHRMRTDEDGNLLHRCDATFHQSQNSASEPPTEPLTGEDDLFLDLTQPDPADPGTPYLNDINAAAARDEPVTHLGAPSAAAHAAAPPPVSDEADLLDVGAMPAGTFKFHGKKLHFTYKGHLDFEKLKKFFELLGPLEAFSFVWELGDSSAGYPHTHALIIWKSAINVNNARKFDFEDIHPHIKKVQTLEQVANIFEYHRKKPVKLEQFGEAEAKEDPHTSAKKYVMRADVTWAQCLKEDTISKQLKGGMTYYRQLYDATRPKYECKSDPDETQEWQQDLMDFCLNPLGGDASDKIKLGTETKTRKRWWNRFVFAFWGPGDTGKSWMAKWLVSQHNFCSLSPMREADLLNLFTAGLPGGDGNYEGAVIDCDRATKSDDPNFKDALKVSEKIKSGNVVSGKYQGKQLTFESKPVFIFSNFEIQNDELFLSKDRLAHTTFEILSDGTCPSFKKFVQAWTLQQN